MSKSTMSTSPGELADRLTIVTLKMLYLENGREFIDEYRNLKEQVVAHNISFYSLCVLFSANQLIWEMEREIRLGHEKKLGLEEVGKRAINIRTVNQQRWAIKNEINAAVDECIEHKDTWSGTVPESSFVLLSGMLYEKVPPTLLRHVFEVFFNPEEYMK